MNGNPSLQNTTKPKSNGCDLMTIREHEDIADADSSNSFINSSVIEIKSDQNVLNKLEELLWRFKDSCLSQTNVPRVFISGVLRVMAQHECFSNFPLDARTLLNRDIVLLEPYTYYHFGIIKGIFKLYEKEQLDQFHKIELVIGIDGLPLTKSKNR